MVKRKTGLFLFLCLLCCAALAGCASSRASTKDTPALPQPQNTTAAQAKAGASPGRGAADLVPKKLERGSDGVPVLSVYDVKQEKLIEESVEEYLPAVLAGEMAGDWPLEALKAQAILARTFVLKFITEKDSRYPSADISTDIAEAQAYNAEAINARIQQAVQETTGLILLTEDNELPYTWFHSHSGGMTESAIAGIDWQGDEPAYVRPTEGMEADTAPWRADFTAAEFIAACRNAGAKVSSCKSIRIGQKGKSGRVVTLVVDGTAVNAARLRISLGSTKMRSTLLTELSVEDNIIRMSGLGYGHGVGLSQWGAHALAQRGWSAEEIALHYYKGLHVVKVW